MEKLIQVNVNEIFEVALEGNLTTGYRWETFIPEEARGKVVLVEETWETADRVPGSPTTQHFRFRAAAPCQTELVFYYKRPWEKKSARDQRSFPLNILENNE